MSGGRKMRRAICPVCRKVVATYRPTQCAPKDGGNVYRAHRDQEGADCDAIARSVHPADYVSTQ